MALKSSPSRPRVGTSRLISDGVIGVGDSQNSGTAGHRERLRERFLNGGADAMPDYELLEMTLFAALPRRDTKPLAKALLARFESFAEVISASRARLLEVKGVGMS